MSARFHYHAKLECGHKTGFDVDADLFQIAIDADDVVVEIPCPECGGRTRSSTEVLPGGENVTHCVTCRKGF